MADGNDDSTTPDTSSLNTQIVQAVDATNSVMSSMVGPEGNGIAYQKVAQAAAFSVQDATDFYRNIMAMSGAAQGVCLEQMIAAVAAQEYDKIPHYETIITTAQATVTFAETNFSNTGTAAKNVVDSFPKG